MSTDVEVRDEQAGAVALSTGDGIDAPGVDLVAWAHAARQAHAIAQSLAETSFVPKAMQRRPDEVCGAILAGRELGLSPMASLRSIDLIDGTPAMRAIALRGLVQSHGHRVWVEESTEHRAIVCGQRRKVLVDPTPNPVERSTWTMDRARKAGLAGKRNWQTHPTAMLVARATAEVCRLIAGDVLIGMPYTVEELTDEGPNAPVFIEPTAAAEQPKPARRTARRAPVQRAPEPLPDVVDKPEPKPEADPAKPVDPAWPDVATPPTVDGPPEPGGSTPPMREARGGVTSTRRVADAMNHAAPAEEKPAGDPSTLDTDEAQAIANLSQVFDVEVIDDPAPAPADLLTLPQSRALHASFRAAGIIDKAARLEYVVSTIGRAVKSSSELTKAEASKVLDSLNRDSQDDPWPPGGVA